MSTTTAFGEETPQCPPGQFRAYWSPERAVLSHLLDQHPRRLTLEELARELGEGFVEETAVRRAVDNLAAACFLHREGAALSPAPAVLSFDRNPAATEF